MPAQGKLFSFLEFFGLLFDVGGAGLGSAGLGSGFLLLTIFVSRW